MKLEDTVTTPGYKDPYMQSLHEEVEAEGWSTNLPDEFIDRPPSAVTPKEIPTNYGIDTLEDDDKAMAFFNILIKE